MSELKVENDRLQLMIDELRNRGAGEAPAARSPRSGSMYATNPQTHALAQNQKTGDPSAPHHPSAILLSGVFDGAPSTSTDTIESSKGNAYSSISAYSDDRDERSNRKKVKLPHIFQSLSNHLLSAKKGSQRGAICLHYLWPDRFSRMEKGLAFLLLIQLVYSYPKFRDRLVQKPSVMLVVSDGRTSVNRGKAVMWL